MTEASVSWRESWGQAGFVRPNKAEISFEAVAELRKPEYFDKSLLLHTYMHIASEPVSIFMQKSDCAKKEKKEGGGSERKMKVWFSRGVPPSTMRLKQFW